MPRILHSMALVDGQMPRLLMRSMRRGAVALLREHDWLTALGALTGVLLLVQIMVLSIFAMESTESLLKSRIELQLEFLEGTDDQQIQEFLSALHELPSIASFQYVTKEQAYTQMQKHDPELMAFIEQVGLENPFPETVAVTLKTIDDYDAFSAFLTQEQWNTVIDPSFLSEATDQEAYIYELIGLTETGHSIAVAFLLMTSGILLFVTTELVRGRLLRRTEEVLIQHLTGAYPMAIFLPLAVEMIILISAAAILSIVLLGGFLYISPLFLSGLTQEGVLQSFNAHLFSLMKSRGAFVLFLEIIAIPLVGGAGTWLGILPKVHSRALVLHRH